MKIRDDILNKVYEKAAIDQTADEYKKRGYTIEREKRIGKMRADLVASKGKKVIVFEFKSGRWNTRKANAITQLRNYVAHKFAGEFKLVIVNPPKEKEIYIDGIEHILYEELLEDTSQVDQLATHVYLEEVTDVEISSIDIDKTRIDVIGSGFVSYKLQYGSDGDVDRGDGLRSTETFPLTFRIYLNHDLEIDEVAEIDIDTSSFYE